MKITDLLSKNEETSEDIRKKTFARECGELTERLADRKSVV